MIKKKRKTPMLPKRTNCVERNSLHPYKDRRAGKVASGLHGDDDLKEDG